MTIADPTTPPRPELIADVLTPALGPVTIDHLHRLTGGASRQTWSLDATDRTGTTHPLILQIEQGHDGTVTGPDFPTEDALLTAATAAGVPTAEIIADSRACRALGTARITRRIDGETLGNRIVHHDRFADLRRHLTPRLGEILAAIHSIPVDAVPDLPTADPLESIRIGLDLLDVRSPTFELALRHLADHPPPPAPPTVLHGDFRIGNLLVDEHDLHLVLDWELAHTGHPLEDLGWPCVRAWRFGADPVVGGIGPTDQLLDAYADAGGTRYTDTDLRWGIILGTLRWGLICAHQSRRHLDGSTRSVELAAIGRRLVENEHDLLDLLEIPAAPTGRSEPPPGSPHGPHPTTPVVDHGRPTAVELVEAVREHLEHHLPTDLDRSTAYELRVARHTLEIVERELRTTPAHPPDVDEAALATRIRDGHEPTPEQLATLRAAVTARLAVANPARLP